MLVKSRDAQDVKPLCCVEYQRLPLKRGVIHPYWLDHNDKKCVLWEKIEECIFSRIV
jgi:hypothetical protein